jgi:hypothetical protein
MGDQISWWVELAVKPGQLDNFEALTAGRRRAECTPSSTRWPRSRAASAAVN